MPGAAGLTKTKWKWCPLLAPGATSTIVIVLPTSPLCLCAHLLAATPSLLWHITLSCTGFATTYSDTLGQADFMPWASTCVCVCVCVLSGKPPPHLMIIIGQDSPFAVDSKTWICAPLMSWWKLGVTHFCRLNCWSVGEDTNSMLANSWWSQRQCFVGL